MELDYFHERHIGINKNDETKMLNQLGLSSLEELINQAIPSEIRLNDEIRFEVLSEHEYAEEISQMASKNRIFSSYIGMGWYDTIVPAPIFRNVFENPVWYTPNNPIEAEISQGRLEALMNFQTVVSELTGLAVANSSLSDEVNAALEAVRMMYKLRNAEQIENNSNKLFIDNSIFPQTCVAIQSYAKYQKIEIVLGDYKTVKLDNTFLGAIVQYPNSDGLIVDYSTFTQKAHDLNCKVAVATDLMALTLLVPPGEWGADICFGSSQRFGVPMFYGGPSAAFFATREEYKKEISGQIVELSKDKYDKPAYIISSQNCEQDFCGQSLFATMSSFYAIYHGAEGLRRIAKRIHSTTALIADELENLGYTIINNQYFDTLKISLPESVTQEIFRDISDFRDINLRYFSTGEIGISIDETITDYKAHELIAVFAMVLNRMEVFMIDDLPEKTIIKEEFLRKDSYLQQSVFKHYHTETELMRYIKRLERKDISLAHAMSSIGGCTMKLNAASELLPLNYSGFQNIHPYAPESQTQGYFELLTQLGAYLMQITGFEGISFQPTSISSAYFAGLATIREYQKSIGQANRNTLIIPATADNIYVVSATQAGFEVKIIECDEQGSINIDDLRTKVAMCKTELAACIITYPSAYGMFDNNIREVCNIIHSNGGQVYMDGANINALIGITNPKYLGADICHLDLHKAFAIPHGGGNARGGPICVANHLTPFLPKNTETDGNMSNSVSSSSNGNVGLLPVAYGYIRMMGSEGLIRATKIAILNANYLANGLRNNYDVIVDETSGRVGNQFILDCKKIKDKSEVTSLDIAKRLMDYGYHAPTVSRFAEETFIIEPTECESLAELDRFIDVMNQISAEIKEVEQGAYSKDDNVFVNAPHPEYAVCADEWTHSYPRSKAAYPLPFVKNNKFWINIGRIEQNKR